VISGVRIVESAVNKRLGDVRYCLNLIPGLRAFLSIGGEMYYVIVDGIPWIDGNGNKDWPLLEAEALADSLEAIGYKTEIAPACHHPFHA
jgi:hypothetical protein